MTQSKFAVHRPPTGKLVGETASRRPAGLTVDTTKGKLAGVMNRNIPEFSPMTPSKTIGVRFNAYKNIMNPDLLMSPKLPSVTSPSHDTRISVTSPSHDTRNKVNNSVLVSYDLGDSADANQKVKNSINIVDESSGEPNSSILDNFGNTDKADHYASFEGECFLKTRADRFKTHWAVIMGNELYCYRNKDDALHRVMHSLAGTFVKDLPEEHCSS
jgi:hypothetical protein